jgi:hypothetical protein
MLKIDAFGLQSITAFLMEPGSDIHEYALEKFTYTTTTHAAGLCMVFVPVLRLRYCCSRKVEVRNESLNISPLICRSVSSESSII